MSKFVNGLKGENVSPTYKSSHQRLREAKAKLQAAQAAGNVALAATLARYVECLKLRFTRKPTA